MKSRPLPGAALLNSAPTGESCRLGWRVFFRFSFGSSALKQRVVSMRPPRAWRAESRGSLRGDVQPVLSVPRLSPRMALRNTGQGSRSLPELPCAKRKA